MTDRSIGIVCKSIDPSRGGHERYINRLIEGLLGREWDITVFVRDSTVPESLLDQITVETVPYVPLGGAITYLTFNYFARKAVRKQSDRLDLVFTTGRVTFGDVYRSGGGIHRIFLENCAGRIKRYTPKHLVACSLEKKLFSNPPPEKIIVNSNMVKQQAMDTYGTAEERIRVVYNGVDTDRYHFERLKQERNNIREELGYDSGDFVCLFTGGSWKRKGLPQLLEAFHYVEDESVKLLIVGHTDERRVRRISEKFGYEERVNIAGFTSEIERHYAASDLLVFPSRYDAGANVVIEALASGLPVITTKTNGTHELIEEKKNGAVVDRAENIRQLAEHISSFSGVVEYDKLREQAFKTGQQYSMDRHLDTMIDVFQRRMSHSDSANVKKD